jgi:phospholipase D1/2
VRGARRGVALAAAWRYTPLSELVTPERIIAWAKAVRGTWWAPIAVVLIYTPSAFVLFPRPLLTLLTVIAFGPWLGFIYGMAGIRPPSTGGWSRPCSPRSPG